MTPQSKAQLARARALKKEQFIAAATRAFAKHGYTGATTKRVAEEAGVSEGLFYHYFPSKRRLLAVIRDRVFADIRTSIAARDDGPRGTECAHLVRAILASFVAHRDFWRTALFNRGDADVKGTLGSEMERLSGEVQQALERALERDGVREPVIQAELLFATIEGITQRFVRNQDYPMDEVTDALVRTLRRSG